MKSRWRIKWSIQSTSEKLVETEKNSRSEIKMWAEVETLKLAHFEDTHPLRFFFLSEFCSSPSTFCSRLVDLPIIPLRDLSHAT